jgi:hypothetical protein
MTHPRRTISRSFSVGFPWGATYCDRLGRALRPLGLATMNDPFKQGSDNAAFFVAADRRMLAAGRALIRIYSAEVEACANLDDLEERLTGIEAVGVLEIIHDWK